MNIEAQAPDEGGRRPDSIRQFATFFVNGLYCGLEVLRVQEILRSQHMTRVPLAPPAVEGLINLRGQIVTAVDLRRCLQLPERPAGQRPFNVVVRSEGGAVSLLVDEIGDVVEVHSDCFEATPMNLKPEHRRLFRGIYKLESRLLLVLDTERLLRFDAAGGPED